MNTYQKFTLILLFVFYCVRSSAVPAYPYPVVVSQPDGTQLTILRNYSPP